MKVLYFTSTGNSLWVARQFTDRPLSIVGLLRTGTFEISDNEAIGIVLPDHVSDLPLPAKEFLAKASLKAPYIFGIVTYGSEIGSTVKELLKHQKCDYANSLLMVDNYFPLFNLEEQLKNQSRKKTAEHLAQIVADVQSRRKFISYPGLIKRFVGAAERIMFPLLGQTVKRFSVDHNLCVKCGICAKVCPMDNISYNPWPAYADNCIMCGACRQNCPQNAIRYKGEKDTLRYRHPDISLTDIINANNSPAQT